MKYVKRIIRLILLVLAFAFLIVPFTYRHNMLKNHQRVTYEVLDIRTNTIDVSTGKYSKETVDNTVIKVKYETGKVGFINCRGPYCIDNIKIGVTYVKHPTNDIELRECGIDAKWWLFILAEMTVFFICMISAVAIFVGFIMLISWAFFSGTSKSDEK